MEHVNHPDHYNLPGKKECIQQMREDFGDYITSVFCLTSAYKYIYRAGHKDGNPEEQDVEKATWYWNYFTEELDPVYDDDLVLLNSCVENGLRGYHD